MPPLRAQSQRPSSTFNHNLGSRIREVRGLLHLSQRDVAARAFLRQDLLCKYEAGIHPPPVRALFRIAQALGKPIDSLLPELAFPDGVDRELYRFFRNIWFLPVESRRIVASVLANLFAFPQTSSASGPLT